MTFQQRDQLVLEHSRLPYEVVWHAKRRLPYHVEADDLVQAGFLGLMEAASRFDPAHGTSFKAWARPRVMGAVMDACRARDLIGREGRQAKKAERLDRIVWQLGHHPPAGVRVDSLSAVSAQARDVIARRWLDNALGRLPDPRCRRVLAEYYFAGRTLRETAQIMRLSNSRVKQLKDEAIAQLRALLEQN